MTETIGAYRFFQNDSVTPERTLLPHHDATINRIGEHNVVLMIQDTTELDNTGKNDIRDLGCLTYESRKGLLLHATIAITPERVCVGVIDGQFLREDSETKPTSIEHHHQRPIEEKESYRWVEGYRRCAQVTEQVPDTMVVMISDRECDIYKVFEEAAKCSHRAEWIIRSSQNRRLDGEVDQSRRGTIKLWESVEKAPQLGRVEFTLPKSHQRKDKQVVASLKANRLRLYPPNRKGRKLPVVEVRVIKLSEINPPQGEEPIEWIILTSLPVNSLEEAVTIIQWYVCRWQIEIYFRILKSGCNVQELQLEAADRNKAAFALYMIIAWRIFYYLMLGREYPNFPCNLVFEEEEWKSVYVIIKGKEPPQEAPQLGDMINMIASLGGYLGRKHDGPQGPKTLWIGFQRMADFALAWRMFKARGDKICV